MKEKIAFNVALGLNIIVGIAFTILTPPFMAPDENRHWVKIVSGGSSDLFVEIENKHQLFINSFLYKGEKSYKIGAENIINKWKENLTDTTKIRLFNFLYSYAPISYLPQIIGYKIGCLFDERPIFQFYSARFFIFILAIVAMLFQIHQFNDFKWLLLTVYSFPTALMVRSSVMVDIFSIILTFNIIFASLKIIENVHYKQNFIIILVSSLLLMYFKLVYIVIGIFSIYCLIKCQLKFNKSVNFLVSYIVLNAFNFLLYYYFYLERLEQIVQSDPSHEAAAGTFIYKFINTLVNSGNYFLATMYGILGWIDILLPQFTTKLCFLSTILLILLNNFKGYTINAISLFTFIFFLIFIFYLFNKVQGQFNLPKEITEKLIWGIQGRYFLPFFPIMVFIFNLPAFIQSVTKKYYEPICLLLSLNIVIICFLSIYKIITFFY